MAEAARHLVGPTVLLAVVVFFVHDPTFRFPLIALLLPTFIRGAARTLDVADATADSGIARAFGLVGFAGFIVGWLLVFAIVTFAVATGMLGVTGTGDLVKVAMLLAGIGYGIAAWFWWPWYVRAELAAWPRQDVRVWATASSRWDRLSMSWRMQQLSRSGRLRVRGFGSTVVVVAAAFGLAVAGTYTGLVAQAFEVALVLALPVAHLDVVRAADALCARWSAGPDSR